VQVSIEQSKFVILRLDRRIQNALPGIAKSFSQPLERLLDGPVKPDHDESKTIYAK
jgi:hypothetical protein